jgi:hypothetical protein
MRSRHASWGTYAQRRWKWCLLHHLPRGARNGTLFFGQRPSGTTRRSSSRLGNGFPERQESHATFLTWSAFWSRLIETKLWKQMDAKSVELRKFRLTLDFGNRWNHAQVVEVHKIKGQIYRSWALVYIYLRSCCFWGCGVSHVYLVTLQLVSSSPLLHITNISQNGGTHWSDGATYNWSFHPHRGWKN